MATEKLSVVASIVPLKDFCQRIGGNQVDVQLLIPPGASPHIYEPPPSVAAKASRARVFVYIGAGLEPWAERLLTANQEEGPYVVEAIQGIALIREVHAPGREPAAPLNAESSHDRGHKESISPGENAHAHEHGNPHVWLDPILAQGICRRIAEAFIHADPAHQETYKRHLEAYLEQLEALHRKIQNTVSNFRIQEYVSLHPAFSYFANRYGLRQVGVIEASPGREPTPKHLQRIVDAIRKYDIRVVFAEPQLSPRASEVIAREAEVEVLTLDPLGGRPPYGTDYIQMMRYNLDMLKKGMR
jgi:zinc transport system substrate-binding protein